MVHHNQRSLLDLLQPEPDSHPYEYVSLDRQKKSLRLIRILGTKSPEGYIQCEIRHALIDDSYICLSYVWGDENYEHTVLLNNKPIKVRNNLHGFLARARRKERLLEDWLWIDALCIDQTNISERNHQVQQMGLIFSRANVVISWLGEDENIAGYLLSGDEILGRDFIWSAYWYRAWITQEVALARKVVLCAGDQEMDFALLLSRQPWLPEYITKLSSKTTEALKERSLIYLISLFRHKACQELRDRVYSLLALRGDGSDLQVDYDTSERMLARKVLICCKKSFCLCSIFLISRVLEPERIHWVIDRSQCLTSGPFAYMILPLVRGAYLPPARCCSFDDEFDDEFMRLQGIPYSHASTCIFELPRQGSMSVILDSNGTISVFLIPQQIWSTSNLLMVRVLMLKGSTHLKCEMEDESRRRSTREMPSGMDVEISGSTCKVFFSLELMSVFAFGVVRNEETCSRVNFQGTKHAALLEEPLLRLCC
jgi:hypothetical protein